MFTAFQKSKAKKGFTLVELIVVISIIAILMLVLVPSLLAYINKANKSKAESNAKMVYDAAISAYTELASKDSATTASALSTQITADETLDGVNYALVMTSTDEVDYVIWAASGTSATSANAAASSDAVKKGKCARWPAA